MKKTCVEDCLIINVNKLKRDDIFRPGLTGSIDWTDGSRIGFRTLGDALIRDIIISFEYSRKKEKEDVSCPVRIIWTDMPNGGKRAWFECPLSTNGFACNRRVGKLYLPWYSKYFGCRHCHDLTYRSRQEWIRPEYRGLFRSFRRMSGF